MPQNILYCCFFAILFFHRLFQPSSLSIVGKRFAHPTLALHLVRLLYCQYSPRYHHSADPQTAPTSQSGVPLWRSASSKQRHAAALLKLSPPCWRLAVWLYFFVAAMWTQITSLQRHLSAIFGNFNATYSPVQQIPVYHCMLATSLRHQSRIIIMVLSSCCHFWGAGRSPWHKRVSHSPASHCIIVRLHVSCSKLKPFSQHMLPFLRSRRLAVSQQFSFCIVSSRLLQLLPGLWAIKNTNRFCT